MTDLRTPPITGGDPFAERVREYAWDKAGGPGGRARRLQILEAGCGMNDCLDLGPVNGIVTGVDVDDPALSSRTRSRADLADWHLGDLRTVPMPPRVFDVVWASHLLERIPHAELVLDRFVAALKPGGLLLLRFRDRDSAFGYLDRRLPRWLRAVLWSRASFRQPPPAVYDRVTSCQGIRSYCMMRGLVITEEYVPRQSVTAFGRRNRLIGALCRVVAALSANRLTAGHSDVALVVRKPENRFARVI